MGSVSVLLLVGAPSQMQHCIRQAGIDSGWMDVNGLEQLGPVSLRVYRVTDIIHKPLLPAPPWLHISSGV